MNVHPSATTGLSSAHAGLAVFLALRNTIRPEFTRPRGHPWVGQSSGVPAWPEPFMAYTRPSPVPGEPGPRRRPRGAARGAPGHGCPGWATRGHRATPYEWAR